MCQEKQLTDENSYKFVKQNMSIEIMSDEETDNEKESEGDRGSIKRPLAWEADLLTKVIKSFDRCHDSGLTAFQKRVKMFVTIGPGDVVQPKLYGIPRCWVKKDGQHASTASTFVKLP